jgi:hypothetical protein
LLGFNVTFYTFASYLDETSSLKFNEMRTFGENITSSGTTTSRNGNGIFCSDFGRNIADKGSGVKDIIDW